MRPARLVQAIRDGRDRTQWMLRAACDQQQSEANSNERAG
jgi:hypothetical protein